MMRIDIDHLTEAELIQLNRRIVERLRFLQQMRAHARMLDFNVGDRVSFQPDGQPVLTGVITRYNKKTVTVVTDSHGQWRVSPNLITRANTSRDIDGEVLRDTPTEPLPRCHSLAL
jgi:hypothetical protein